MWFIFIFPTPNCFGSSHGSSLYLLLVYHLIHVPSRRIIERMEYCTHCSGKLTKHSETSYECGACSHRHYRNPVATVGIALHKGGGVIVCSRRKYEPFKGRLDCIGGFVDYGENNEQALERELKEEVSVGLNDLSRVRYLNSVHAIYPWMGKEVSLVCALFIADIKPGVKLVAGDDVAALEEFDLHQTLRKEDFEDDWMYVLLSAAKAYLGIS